MTNAQLATIKKIEKNIPYFDFYSEDDYEVKQFEITECDGFIDVYIVTGMKGDDGTMAAVLCRKYRHGFIGKRGGVSIVNSKGKCARCSVFAFMNKHYRT